MSRRGCILGEPEGWHVRSLAAALGRRGLDTAVVRWQDLTAEVAGRAAGFGPAPLAAADLVAVRGMPGTAPPEARLEEVIFRMDVLGRLAAGGTPVVNPPRSLEIAIDKYLCLAHLAATGIAVPHTLVVQDPEGVRRGRQQLGGSCVAKPLFGSRGRGLVRLDSDAAIETIRPTAGGVFYLQEFVPHRGWDARVFVVGERLFAMRRWARAGEWRTNLALGGRPERFDLPAGWGDLARRAAAAVNATLAGVDLLPASDGRLLVLEVNAVPGWRGLESVTGPEVGEAVADHLVSLARA